LASLFLFLSSTFFLLLQLTAPGFVALFLYLSTPAKFLFKEFPPQSIIRILNEALLLQVTNREIETDENVIENAAALVTHLWIMSVATLIAILAKPSLPREARLISRSLPSRRWSWSVL
jgi:DMSO reductase anchor subunit